MGGLAKKRRPALGLVGGCVDGWVILKMADGGGGGGRRARGKVLSSCWAARDGAAGDGMIFFLIKLRDSLSCVCVCVGRDS